MKRVAFIGAYDKTDMMIYVAKILVTLGKKVLIVDSTINQKARYIVPAINPTVKYVTEFEEIDIAIGFENFDDIKGYLYISAQDELPYDFIFIDVDNIQKLEAFEIEKTDKKYFVTSFDAYSLKKGLEALSMLKEPMGMTKILYSKEMLKKDDDYLNLLAANYKVIWNDFIIYFPIDNGDLSAIIENQMVAKVKFRKLSAQYKDGLVVIASEILKDTSEMQIRRAVKLIEKGV